MSVYTVELTHKADKQYFKLEPKMKMRVKEAIDALQENPAPVNRFDVTKLIGSQSDYRIRIGDYRIQYTVNWKDKFVSVYDIDKKKDRSYK
jgi:mRNA interferase RelE/StbE